MKLFKHKNLLALLGCIGTAMLSLMGMSLLVSISSQPAPAASAQDNQTSTYRLTDLEADVPITALELTQTVRAGLDTPIPIQRPNACSSPIVFHGSIVTATSPTLTGRLIRNGLPGTCGESYTCSGVQNTSTNFSYQKVDFTNTSTSWQCIQVLIDSRACVQQVYSAVYQNTFDSANLCTNIEGAMGYSTAGIYGYSFSAPPNSNFSIVNNTTGTVPPGSNCSNYTMTVTLCTSNVEITATKKPVTPMILADSLGHAVAPIGIVFHNNGDFTGAVDATSVSETVNVVVQDGGPATIITRFGQAGAIVKPGGTITQTVKLDFSGSPLGCLPRFYRITGVQEMVSQVYHCDGFNPPSGYEATGSILPLDNFMEDAYAFQSVAGTRITITVDTVSAESAFDIEACLSDTPQGSCLPGLSGDDNLDCTFAPPAFGCPNFGGNLPDDSDGDGIYYVRVSSGSGVLNFAGPEGSYRVTTFVSTGPGGACRLIPVLDNGANSFLLAAGPDLIFASTVPTQTIFATVKPITVRIPPLGGVDCRAVYLPLVQP